MAGSGTEAPTVAAPWSVLLSQKTRDEKRGICAHALRSSSSRSLPLFVHCRCSMPSEDEPLADFGTPGCTVGLNEGGGQVGPVAPHFEMDRPPHNVAVDVAPDSAGNSRHPTLSTASSVPCEAAAAAVGAATVMPAQPMTPQERQCEILRRAREKKGKKASSLQYHRKEAWPFSCTPAAKVKRKLLPASPPQPTAAHRSQPTAASQPETCAHQGAPIYKCWLCATSFKYGASFKLCKHKLIEIDPEHGFCVQCVRARRMSQLCPVGCQVAAHNAIYFF